MKESLPRLDGSWEKSGRNPALASVIIVLTLGSLYFLAGNLASVAVMAARAWGSAAAGNFSGFGGMFSPGGDFLENMKRSYAENRGWILALTSVCQFAIFLGAGFGLSKKWFSSDVAAYSGYSKASARDIILGVAAAVLVLPVVDSISRVTDSFFPTFTKLGEATAVLYQWDSPIGAVFTFFCISATPAICEEAFFRGVFQRGLQRKLRFPWSFLVSGVVFAFYHQSALSIPALIPVGVLLGFLYWSFDSIWPGMALHATYNGLILLLSNQALPLPAFMANGNYFSWPVWAAGVLGLAGLCVYVGAEALKRKGRAALDGGLPCGEERAETA
jgi:membrane protease YdiL (CAAX protease family)